MHFYKNQFQCLQESIVVSQINLEIIRSVPEISQSGKHQDRLRRKSKPEEMLFRQHLKDLHQKQLKIHTNLSHSPQTDPKKSVNNATTTKTNIWFGNTQVITAANRLRLQLIFTYHPLFITVKHRIKAPTAKFLSRRRLTPSLRRRSVVIG